MAVQTLAMSMLKVHIEDMGEIRRRELSSRQIKQTEADRHMTYVSHVTSRFLFGQAFSLLNTPMITHGLGNLPAKQTPHLT